MTEPSPAPPGPDTSPRPLLKTADRLGALVWAEQRAFEVLSRWSRDGGDPEIQVVFAVQARHHAWRAEQLAARFPAITDVDLADRLAPDDPGIAGLFFELEGLGADALIDRLVAACRVLLPRLVADHEVDLARTAEVADAPLRRTLRQVLADERDDLDAAEAALSARLGAEADATAAGALVERLTAMLDGATAR